MNSYFAIKSRVTEFDWFKIDGLVKFYIHGQNRASCFIADTQMVLKYEFVM